MAPRVNKIRHDDKTRAKIRTSQLLNRLNDHVFKGIEVSATQLKSIEILLKKTLPDLTAVTISGDPENPLKIEGSERVIVDPKNSNSESI